MSKSTVINRARAAAVPPRPADSSRIPDDVTAAVIKSYTEDTETKLVDIAEMHGVSVSTVIRAAKEAGVWQRPVTSNRRLDHAAIIEAYKDPNVSVAEIAEIHECSRRWVGKMAKPPTGD